MSLALIAQTLIASVEAGMQPMRYPLERGLHLTLWRNGEDIILSLTRSEVVPSESEVNACRRAFNIPDDATQETDQKQGWHIIRLRWAKPTPRSEQPPLFEPPATTGHNYHQK